MVRSGLAFPATADPASLPTTVQADCLRELEQAESMHTAARASMLSEFAARRGFEDDGHGSAKTWLKWQTSITSGAAAKAMGWARRLCDHPAIGRALAWGEVSQSWARQICDWTDLLPEAHRGDADAILLAAAAGGAELAACIRRLGLRLDGMSAEPVQVEDPNDPEVILRDLPEQERAQFLRQYHEAVDAAHDPAGYRRLQRLLHAWSGPS